MKSLNKNYVLGVFAILVIGFLSYNFFTKECSGSECVENQTPKTQVSKYDIYPEMDPSTLATKVKNGEIFLLDVRETSEWNEGHIEGATLIPLGNLNIETTKNLPKDKPMYVYCRSGRRAGEAENILIGLGFTNAFNIGGINHWLERNGTLVK